MDYTDLHSALKTTVVCDLTERGFLGKHVRLQLAKDHSKDVLHICPDTHSSIGVQSTDYLSFLGFRRSHCAFHLRGECYCKELPADHDMPALLKAIASSFDKFARGASDLQACGLFVGQPEGWGFFFGKPSEGRPAHVFASYGDGHVAPKSQRMKESEDEFFKFVFTWIEGSAERGWTTHYRAKHMPLSDEFQAALNFLKGFSWFSECPEFDFNGCWWRFTPFEPNGNIAFNPKTEYAHACFDAHAKRFSPGLVNLLSAHAELAPHGLSFLSFPPATAAPSHLVSAPPPSTKEQPPNSKPLYSYDVALSFASPERPLAEKLATLARDAGLRVFYDGFYPEQLWGKDLPSFFDRVYRRESRFCVMFLSSDYAKRMWTTHERKSALSRAVAENGNEYILPIRIDGTDVDGLPPTIGHLDLAQHTIEQIAELLVQKVSSAV